MKGSPRRLLVDLIVPVAVAGALVLLQTLPYVRAAELWVYDQLLFVRPSAPERPEILLLNIDDAAVGEAGHWPWNRPYLARALILLRELGSGHVVFDIDHLDEPAAMSGSLRQHDAYLDQAARFHGSGYYRVHGSADRSPEQRERMPDADRDGVRRRVDLVSQLSNASSDHLVVPPLLDWIGRPVASVVEDAVILGGARVPGTDGQRTIRIPLTTDRRMLINWPRARYEESFRHMTYQTLIRDWTGEDAMVAALRAMRMRNLMGLFDEEVEVLERYEAAAELQREVLESGDPDRIGEWRKLRESFFTMVGELLASDARDRLLARAQEAVEAGMDGPIELEYRYAQQEARRLYAELDRIYAAFLENRARLMEEIPGSFVIVGHVAAGTTETSVTPFHDEYPNAGVSAALVNTVLQQDFLVDLPWWVAPVVLVIVATIVTLAAGRLDVLTTLLVGLGTLIPVTAGAVLLFVLTGVYIDVVTIGGGIVLTVLVLDALDLARAHRRRAEVRRVFAHAVPDAVLRRITRDPSTLALDGVRKDITVLSVDVQGLSAVSDVLAPEQFTAMLDGYLAAMSGIITDEGGTVGRCHAGEITAFWNAPLGVAGHPVRACRAAIRMRSKEAELNEQYLRSAIGPDAIHPRIGIHTAPMVVGYLGTASRRVYTVTGPHADAAARLGRVNAQYGTTILITEQAYWGTCDETQGAATFSARRLDRVRFPGIAEPVRIYELIDTCGLVHGDRKLTATLSAFDAGLSAFEAKEWASAARHFREIMRACPNDGPARYYAGRASAFARRPPAADWDGVYNLGRQ